jgi:broad specificity phosphatase PhoE
MVDSPRGKRNKQRWLLDRWLDVALTEKGKTDAASLSDILHGVSFDKIYSSDLSRARNTADIAIPGCNNFALQHKSPCKSRAFCVFGGKKTPLFHHCTFSTTLWI